MGFGRQAINNRGTSQRVNRNVVAFLAPDARRTEDMDGAVRDYLARRSIAGSHERITELGLPPQPAAHSRRKLTDADRTVDLRIADAYYWVIVPVQNPGRQVSWEALNADGANERLAERLATSSSSPTCCASCTTHATSATAWPAYGSTATSRSGTCGIITVGTHTCTG